MYDELEFSALIGKTLASVTGKAGDDEMIFTTDSGEIFKLYHCQGCCESVTIEDIEGDLTDLIGAPIVLAEESSNSDQQPGQDMEWVESFTWTFYRIATTKGFVVVRWLGESNGYYSESVDFEKIN